MFVALAFLIVRPAEGTSLNSDEVNASKILGVVKNVAHNVETIRQYTGARKSNILQFSVGQVATHNVYFQALTLFEKINRLSLEYTRLQPDLPQIQPGVRTPGDVLDIVIAAENSVERIMRELQIPQSPFQPSLQQDASATEVFAAISHLNRQLNILIEKKFNPGDVFMQVTLAVGYASNLLEPFSDSVRIPDEPPLAHGKTPSDVFFKLVECIDTISGIYREYGLVTFILDVADVNPNDIHPSDVYEMAAMVVAQLDFLQTELSGIERPLAPYYPGLKFPSDVYQRASLLKLQLDDYQVLSIGNTGTGP